MSKDSSLLQRRYWLAFLCAIIFDFAWGVIIYRTALEQPLNLLKLLFYIFVGISMIGATLNIYRIMLLKREIFHNGKPKDGSER